MPIDKRRRSVSYPEQQTAERPDVRVGIVLPVHNEELLVSSALASLERAIVGALEPHVECRIVVVLDSCSDKSSGVVNEWLSWSTRGEVGINFELLQVDASNVGMARQQGCARLLRIWSNHPIETIWLATTDADSEVPEDWICRQLAARHEGHLVWAGGVEVRDWSGRAQGTEDEWRRQNDSEAMPIHGANFGIDAGLYLRAGGFRADRTGEDKGLFERATALGATIGYDPASRVITSGRKDGRAPHGFTHALSRIEERISTSVEGQYVHLGLA